MISPEEIIIQLEQEAAEYPDGSYRSNLNLGACGVIRELIQRLEAADELNAELRCSRDGCQAQVKLLREALELNGGKQKPGKRKKKARD